VEMEKKKKKEKRKGREIVRKLRKNKKLV